MAKPIKETPYLTGKDARKFISDNKNVKKVTKEEMFAIEKSYNALREILENQLK